MKNSTDQHSKQSNGEPVTFQRISPKSDGSKLFKIDTLDIGAMVNEITNEAKSDFLNFLIKVNTRRHLTTLHRDAFCQFPFRWIYYYNSNKSTGK